MGGEVGNTAHCSARTVTHAQLGLHVLSKHTCVLNFHARLNMHVFTSVPPNEPITDLEEADRLISYPIRSLMWLVALKHIKAVKLKDKKTRRNCFAPFTTVEGTYY